MNMVVRWLCIVIGATGVALSALNFSGMVETIRSNGLTSGEPVGLREHYLQVGAFYSRGFTTGFFFCFSLMLVAVAVGTWYDERRKARRAVASAVLAAPPAPSAQG